MSRFCSAAATHHLIYLAPVPLHALLEVQALVRSFHAPFPIAVAPHKYVVFAVSVNSIDVVDLGDHVQRWAIAGSAQELTGDWRAYPLRGPTGTHGDVRSNRRAAPTQELGARLHQAPGIAGFLAPSAYDARFSNLVVFPDKISVDDACCSIHPHSDDDADH